MIVISEKETGRVVFATHEDRDLTPLWPLGSHDRTRTEMEAAPSPVWEYTVRRDPTYVLIWCRHAPDNAEYYHMRAERGRLLLRLLSIIEAKRKLRCSDLLGQDLVYAEKLKEARAYLKVDQGKTLRWLEADANTSVTSIKEQAMLICMKHEQQMELLAETEAVRRRLKRRILEANLHEFSRLEQEISDYERKP